MNNSTNPLPDSRTSPIGFDYYNISDFAENLAESLHPSMTNAHAQLTETFETFNQKNQPGLQTELESLVGVNDVLLLEETTDFYLPLCQYLLHKYYINNQKNDHNRADGEHNCSTNNPFIIGISGGVAVGKSTTARVIHALLSKSVPETKLITTDNFLRPNKALEASQLMSRKGFPESYNTSALINCLLAIKRRDTQHISIPTYSHTLYDIVPDQLQTISQPKIVILEGLNALQPLPIRNQGSLTLIDLLDYAIYVNAEINDLRTWYVERFFKFRATAFLKPDNRWHEFTKMNDQTAKASALKIYDEINGPNLKKHILPTKKNADFIIEKGSNHKIIGVHTRQH